MNLIMLTTVRLCIILLEASTAKGSARAQPMTVPNIDILIVSTSGDTTFPKKLHLGWKIFPRITKSSFILENTVAKLKPVILSAHAITMTKIISIKGIRLLGRTVV